MRLILCVLSVIYVFQQRTFIDLRAAIADIGDLKPAGAYFLNKVGTMLVTVRTQLTVWCRWPVAFLSAAYVFRPAGLAMLTGIKRISGPPCSDCGHLFPDLPGYGGRIFSECAAYFFKRETFSQEFLE